MTESNGTNGAAQSAAANDDEHGAPTPSPPSASSESGAESGAESRAESRAESGEVSGPIAAAVGFDQLDASAPRALRVGALLGVLFLAASIVWDVMVAQEQIEHLLPWRAGAIVVIAALGALSWAMPGRAVWFGAVMSAAGAVSIGVVVGKMPHGLPYGTAAFVMVAMVTGFIALDGKAALASVSAAGVLGAVALWLGGASEDAMLAIGFFYLPAAVGAVLIAHTTHLRIDRAASWRHELYALREDLARFGHHDELTGVHDEKQLQQLARREISLARRRKSALSALKIDVQRIEDINTKHGRGAGDETLRAVASMCQATLRETDLLARLPAGDEFAAVLPEADADGAAAICERLKKSLAKASVLAGGQVLEVSVSVASATLAEGDHGIDDLLQRADKSLKAQRASTS